jgi:hypothetical protein
LCSDENFSLIDAELYLPTSWINDNARSEKAGVSTGNEYRKRRK